MTCKEKMKISFTKSFFEPLFKLWLAYVQLSCSWDKQIFICLSHCWFSVLIAEYNPKASPLLFKYVRRETLDSLLLHPILCVCVCVCVFATRHVGSLTKDQTHTPPALEVQSLTFAKSDKWLLVQRSSLIYCDISQCDLSPKFCCRHDVIYNLGPCWQSGFHMPFRTTLVITPANPV